MTTTTNDDNTASLLTRAATIAFAAMAALQHLINSGIIPDVPETQQEIETILAMSELKNDPLLQPGITYLRFLLREGALGHVRFALPTPVDG